jgi:hypothetical protein
MQKYVNLEGSLVSGEKAGAGKSRLLYWQLRLGHFFEVAKFRNFY